MKKHLKQLGIYWLALCMVILFNQCEKDQLALSDNQNKTNTDKLCIPQGWVMESATVSPAIQMLNGSWVTNLMNGWLYNYELDDIIKFFPNGTQIINGGTIVPEPGELFQAQDYAYTWSFNNDETKLNMQVPFFYDNDIEQGSILELNENKLKISFTFSIAKSVHTFTLTYIPR